MFTITYENTEHLNSAVKSIKMELYDGNTWPELLNEFINFLKAMEFNIPDGEYMAEEEIDSICKSAKELAEVCTGNCKDCCKKEGADTNE